jgi:predicted transcriptional regulator of viral defense system
MHTPVSAANVSDELISRGRYWATSGDIAELTALSGGALHQALVRLRKAGNAVSPAKGFWVMVPPEYRNLGAPPPDWYVDAMLAALDRDYYVSFLTAAAAHGARHQAAMSFQIVVDRALRARRVGRTRFEFTVDSHVTDMDVVAVPTHTGSIRMASRETTAVDLVWKPSHAGGLGNTLTVLSELGDLNPDRLAALAALRSTAVVRRLGWLLARARADLDLTALQALAHEKGSTPTDLRAGGPRRGAVDPDWLVRVNADVEADT